MEERFQRGPSITVAALVTDALIGTLAALCRQVLLGHFAFKLLRPVTWSVSTCNNKKADIYDSDDEVYQPL